MFIDKKILGIALFSMLAVSEIAIAQVNPCSKVHFFPEGVIQAKTPTQQWQEWLNTLEATESQMSNTNTWGSLVINNSITKDKVYFGQKVKVIFDGHMRVGDKIRYTSFNTQKYITEQEMRDLEACIDQQVNEAVEKNYDFWKVVEPQAIKIAADIEKVSESDFRASLDKEDPFNPGIKFRDLRQIVLPIEKKDFIPSRELHIGVAPDSPTVLGLAWLNVGVIHYTPLALLSDYIKGDPNVLAHEFVHTNVKLQSMPMAWIFDAEAMASLPEMLLLTNHLDLLRHSYARDFREIIWVYFSFDFDRVRKEVVKELAGVLVIDEAAFDKALGQLSTVKKEIYPAFQKVVSTFYANPLWWATLHRETGLDNFVFELVMASLYNPTLLGGQDKTMRFCLTNEGVIREMMDRAYGKSRGDRTRDNENMRNERIANLFFGSVLKQYDVSDEEIEKFLKQNRVASVGELIKWEPARLKSAIEKFIRERGGKE